MRRAPDMRSSWSAGPRPTSGRLMGPSSLPGGRLGRAQCGQRLVAGGPRALADNLGGENFPLYRLDVSPASAVPA